LPVILENFEDGSLDYGIVASAGGVAEPGFRTDSVDADDGSIDGSGTLGRSWFTPDQGDRAAMTFTFAAPLPRAAGIVWTDGEMRHEVYFEAFGPGMESLGILGPFLLAGPENTGETGEDRFFGAKNPDGILALRVTNLETNSLVGGLEIDHIQFQQEPFEVFSGDLGGFVAAVGAGTGGIAIDFENFLGSTILTNGVLLNGAYLSTKNDGAPLHIIDADNSLTPDGFSGVVDAAMNRLSATSGSNVLSPGGPILAPGPNADFENDDLTIDFPEGVPYFGVDILFQSADQGENVSIRVLSATGATIYDAPVDFDLLDGQGGGVPAGNVFWGILMSGSNLIHRVEINEGDGDALFPDSNIGYDTLRFPISARTHIPDIISSSATPGTLSFSFASLLNHMYDIEFTGSLESVNWEPIGLEIEGNGTVLSPSYSPNQEIGFFRITGEGSP